MKVIERDYLKTLQKVKDTPDIKVITGVRRSGKSMLLSNFKEYIAKTVIDANIIEVDFNSIEYEHLREYHALNNYIESRFLPGRRNYVFIDEVQMCQSFEKTINSLHNSKKYDIYITGSNAFLSANDLATLLAGRVFPVEIFPFSFKEFQKYYKLPDKYQAFERYLFEGGFAGSYIYDDLAEKYRYIANIYDTTIIRDIQQKYHIQNTPTLNKVSDFLIDNISRLTTGRNIANTLTSASQNTNHKTVNAYLEYLCNAFAFYKVKRYDIEGKDYLRSQDKYYLVDHAIKYAKLGTKFIDYGSAYENIVAIELKRRGYEIYIGTFRGKEIDFVAKRRNEFLYIQVSYNIDSQETLQREARPLLGVRDAYPKIILAHTRQPEYQYEGIRIIDVADWLMTE